MSATGSDLLVNAYGDSFVAGVGDPVGIGWIGRLVQNVREGGRNVELVNGAEPGATSVQAVAHFFNTRIEPVEERSVDQRVILSFGSNDVISGTPEEFSVAALESALVLTAELKIPAFVVGPPPVGGVEGAEQIVAELSHKFAELCDLLGAPFVETQSALLEPGPWKDESAAGDGSHPQAGGYDQLSELLIEAGLLEWLQAS